MKLRELGNPWPEFKPCDGTLVIVGSARCVWEDLSKINFRSHDVMCLNDMIMHFPGELSHVYSNDHRWLPKWLEARRPRYVKDFQKTPVVHTCQTGASTMKVWPWPGHGSSGLNACYTGLALGYERIILCGIPLDDSGHYFDPPWVKTNFNKEVPEKNGEPRYWENAAKQYFDGKVKSMSGRTKDLLGAP